MSATDIELDGSIKLTRNWAQNGGTCGSLTGITLLLIGLRFSVDNGGPFFAIGARGYHAGESVAKLRPNSPSRELERKALLYTRHMDSPRSFRVPGAISMSDAVFTFNEEVYMADNFAVFNGGGKLAISRVCVLEDARPIRCFAAETVGTADSHAFMEASFMTVCLEEGKIKTCPLCASKDSLVCGKLLSNHGQESCRGERLAPFSRNMTSWIALSDGAPVLTIQRYTRRYTKHLVRSYLQLPRVRFYSMH